MKVRNEIDPIDYTPEKDGSPPPKLIITDAWNRKGCVNVQIGDSKKITVNAEELRKAIKNATENP